MDGMTYQITSYTHVSPDGHVTIWRDEDAIRQAAEDRQRAEKEGRLATCELLLFEYHEKVRSDR